MFPSYLPVPNKTHNNLESPIGDFFPAVDDDSTRRVQEAEKLVG